MHFDDTDAGDVYNIMNSFTNKATKDTKISALTIANEAIYLFTNALAGVINKSLQQLGVLSSQLKITRLTPIYMEGPKIYINNHRPISLIY